MPNDGVLKIIACKHLWPIHGAPYYRVLSIIEQSYSQEAKHPTDHNEIEPYLQGKKSSAVQIGKDTHTYEGAGGQGLKSALEQKAADRAKRERVGMSLVIGALQ